MFQTIADVIRTSLGPRAMLKMLMDPMGGIFLSNLKERVDWISIFFMAVLSTD